MQKVGKTPNAQSITGWINAALFVEGLRLAGPNPTWQGVVDAINTRATAFTAGGVTPAIDWRVAHDASPRTCSAYVVAQGGKFELRFAEPDKPYVCFRQDPQPETLDAPERAAK